MASSRSNRIGGLAVLALLAAGLLAPAGAAGSTRAPAPRPLYFGFADSLFASGDDGVREHWVERAVSSGASIVRINVRWRDVAPKDRPAGFSPSDPGSPGYEWKRVDAAVRTAAGHGLRVLLTVASAPRWAEGPERAPSARPGTWKPRPAAFGRFARALARRYGGAFPDPLRPGRALPRVRFFEAWNEPNLDYFLSPQWGGNRQWVGPGIYRNLLNSFYAGVKSAQPAATVIGGSMAPYGDPPGGERTPPVVFLRRLLCLKGGRLRRLPCPRPARFDALSDHPISPVKPPWVPADNPLDASSADLGRLTRVLRRAERARTVLPRGRKGLWVTEFWLDTDPPDPDATPPYKQARWYEQDLYQFWRAGAEAAIEFQLVDAGTDQNGGYHYTLQSGVFFADGRPKPSRTAVRFPFVSHRSGPARVLAWGIAPRPGLVRVQARRGGRWRTLASVRARGLGRPFTLTLPLRGHALLRARLGRESSLTWRLR